MNRQYPIYTRETECQDCYKCVRHCPAKAIKIEKGRAAVIPELCVACGQCVQVCPAGAKQVRDDLERVRSLLRSKQEVMLSLAPAWVSEFPDMGRDRLLGLIRQAGFSGVSETALGAQVVAEQTVDWLERYPRGLHLSTACPAAALFVKKYLPKLAACLVPVSSPMLEHGRMLKEALHPGCAVVFAGPCIGKKNESDEFPNWVDCALTFADLRRLLEEQKAYSAGNDRSCFEPCDAGVTALFPVNGGMIESMEALRRARCGGGLARDVRLVTLCGLDHIFNSLKGIDVQEGGVFVELLACEGGCVGGPCMTNGSALLTRDLAVRAHVSSAVRVAIPAVTGAACVLSSGDAGRNEWSKEQLRQALQRVGKYTPADELNCGGCGYESCVQFAAALMDGRAEPAMCLSWLRRQAQKKANALLRSMPSSVVIVDAGLHVIECNENFARMFGEETLLSYQVRPGLEGARLDRILPFAHLFQRVLEQGGDFRHDAMRVKDRLLNVTLFCIEQGSTVGGIFLDATENQQRREYIAGQAREVIQKNLATVQDIACMLGEHMAETEILLRSIADDYAAEELLETDPR